MGSAKVSNATVITMSESEKKSLKKRIISFFNKDKKKEKSKNEKEKPKIEPENNTAPNKVQNPVDKVLERLENLKLENRTEKKVENEEDESEFFSYKIVEDDSRSARIDSQSSEDSGFADTKVDEVVASMSSLKVDGEKKKKKTKTVVLPRGPVRGKVNCCNVRPYPAQKDDGPCRQINQINKHTLTGGQVIVNSGQSQDNYSEIDIALKSVEKISQSSQKEEEYWDDVLDLIHADVTQKTEHRIPETLEGTIDFLSEFGQIQHDVYQPIHIVPTVSPEPNPIDEFSTTNHLNYEDCVDVTNILDLGHFDAESPKASIFPTPPHSENIPSPMSEYQTSFYPGNSDYTLSPERSSPIYNSDYEKYQDLTPFDEFPQSNESSEKRERTSSLSSMTMKQFKDLQKEIGHAFSKKECCEVNRKPCKEILQEHMSRIKKVDRKNLCLRVAKLDLKTCYGVLHHVLISLSKNSEQDDFQYSLFGLICERVLAQKPALFAYDFGLNLLKSASLRCPHRPILTRHLVYCIRTALKIDPTVASSKESAFNEVDAQGDTLVIALARAGDSYAQVLSEIVRNDYTDQPPLFRIHHTNADGYTALHVCCSQHSAISSKLHIAHVLLEHAGADIWKGDLKGGDTALHLAVNSANCDVQLVMMLFKQIDRKQWKSLAHCRNMSSVTPLEYARSATKSTTRQKYPQEVLDFLKKCR